MNSDAYDIDIDMSADLGYYTTYASTQTTAPVLLTESYGLRFYALLTLNIAQNIMNAYSN